MSYNYKLLATAIALSLTACATSPSDKQVSGAKAVINQEYLQQNPDAIAKARQEKDRIRQEKDRLAQLELEQQLDKIHAEKQKQQLLAEQEQAMIRAKTAAAQRALREEETRLKELKHKQDTLRAEKQARIEAAKMQEERRAKAEQARKEYLAKAPTYYVFPGESYQTAISRWLHAEGFDNIAWANDNNLLDALERSYPSDGEIKEIKAYVHDAIAELKQVDKQLLKADLSITLDRQHQLAGVHPWPNRRVKITLVDGENLRIAVRNVVRAYNWKWNSQKAVKTGSGQPRKSWGPDYEFRFGSPYPIITPEDDINAALDIVLKGYPVTAGRSDSTRHIYISEEQL